MEEIKNEEVFVNAVRRVNRIFIIMSIFYLVYFLFQTKVNVFLFLLALSHITFALLSHKHLMITDRLSIELERARTALGDVSRDMRDMHPDIK